MSTTTSTTTTGNHEAGTPETFALGAAADFLVAGTNVLAIEGHNTSLGSSDFSLIPELRITSGIVQNGPVAILGTSATALQGTISSPSVVVVTIDGQRIIVKTAQGLKTFDRRLLISITPEPSTVFRPPVKETCQKPAMWRKLSSGVKFGSISSSMFEM